MNGILCWPPTFRLNLELQYISKVYLGSMCPATYTHWLRSRNPLPPAFGLIYCSMGLLYWSAKIDDISLWPRPCPPPPESHALENLCTPSWYLSHRNHLSFMRSGPADTLHCKDTVPKLRNKYSQKRNCVAFVPISTFLLCDRFIYSHDRSAYSAAENIWK